MSQPEAHGGAAGGAELTYEQARKELGEIVVKLESGGASLAESMQLWERGEQLAKICQDWLDGAQAKIQAARTLQEPEDR